MHLNMYHIIPRVDRKRPYRITTIWPNIATNETYKMLCFLNYAIYKYVDLLCMHMYYLYKKYFYINVILYRTGKKRIKCVLYLLLKDIRSRYVIYFLNKMILD